MVVIGTPQEISDQSIGHKPTELVPFDEELEINLRSSCLRCKFLANCPVVEDKAGPSMDTLIGTYRISALRKRCLL